MNVGSLFSGAGLLDYGLTCAGFDHTWFCEADPYCQQILGLRWPGVTIHSDARTLENAEPVDLIAGGFPCQPFSQAGKRAGMEDARWLWPHFARTIRVLRPRYVIVENVPGLLAGHGGMGAVLGDLAEMGYDTEWGCLSAADFGAPHLRERIFVVAYPDGSGRTERQQEVQAWKRNAQERSRKMADPTGKGLERRIESQAARETRPEPARQGSDALQDTNSSTLESWRRRRRTTEAGTGMADTYRESLVWVAEPRPESPSWPPEPSVGRMAYGVPHRVDRLKALGNGVVPTIAEWLGRKVLEDAAT